MKISSEAFSMGMVKGEFAEGGNVDVLVFSLDNSLFFY